MYKSLFAFTAAATVFVAINAAQAMPVTSGAMRDAVDATDMVEKTAIYVVEGRRYCFYFSGWHGPGWYRCGYAFRRGLGWGGVYGWQGWDYGPAQRRFGRGDVTIRESSRGVRDGTTSRRSSTVREGTTTRERSTVREGATVRSGVKERSTSTRDSATVRGGAAVESRTSGSGQGAVTGGGEVKGGGKAKPSGGAARGGDGGGQGSGGGRGGDKQ